ncbi:MAG: PilZ domain-containing protein [Nitrospira sp.]|jgi:c-di-GMP-binding flagellar brake protein YcgR|nr:PilZ domain-containing protein [Nitrospira sp.]
MQTRYSQRVSVDCSVMFAGENVVGEGRILDLSLPGCLLESSNNMTAGEYIQLRLFLPDRATPLHVALAAVRWVDGCKLGVEFIRTSQEEQRRLAQFVKQQSRSNPSPRWSESVVLIGTPDR